MTMTTLARQITGGVDTHLDVHVAAALDERGALLGVESFETTPKGYTRLLAWLEGFGSVELSVSNGTGSYGAGLTRHLDGRRRPGGRGRPSQPPAPTPQGSPTPKTPSPLLGRPRAGDATGEAKTRDGNVEAMRVLRVARASARKGRNQALNQMRSLISTGPDCVRAELRGLNVYRMLERALALSTGHQAGPGVDQQVDPADARPPAIELEAEVKEIDAIMKAMVAETARHSRPSPGSGTEWLGLLVAAGDNPERLRNEASFAQLCGTSPIDASSGKNQTAPLNRSGDRQANSALWHIVITRMVSDPRTRHYIERRMKEGQTKKEAIRCLKRYIAREVYNNLPMEHLALDSP